MNNNFERTASKFMLWSLTTFQNATAESCMTHLKTEIKEVEADIDYLRLYPNNKIKICDLAEEYADCIGCILSSAARMGINAEEIVDALEEKYQKNRCRQWRENSDKTYSHIK